MDLGLTGRPALVAAASKGMGRAVAEGLAREGARVAIFARTEADVRLAADEIRAATGAEVLALAGDVTRAADVERMVGEAAGRFGGLRVLVTNAGGPPLGLFDEMDDAKWQAAFELNLLSVIRLIRAAVPHLRAAGGDGTIVNVSSIAGHRPIGSSIPYAASKAAVSHMTALLANVLGPDVRVNAVAPGEIETAMLSPETEVLITRIPLHRLGKPDDVAAAIFYLCSAESGYVTGTEIFVTGGQHLY